MSQLTRYNQQYMHPPPLKKPHCYRPPQYGSTTTTTVAKKPLPPPTKTPVCTTHHTTPTATTPFLQPAYPQETPQELSSWNFFLCSLCLAGVQFTWTVELAYGSPYLLELGLSKALMSLVWLAGPISGLLVAPILGSYSDNYKSRFGRRRPFMVVSAALSVLSLSLVGYAKLIGYHIATHILTAPSRDELARMSTHVAIIVAVIGFYLLDFSINSVQASCRALVLDQAPLSQQGLANSWAGRMIGLGNVAGYFVGYLDLPANLPFLGTGQVPVLCTIASIVLSATIGVTCVSVTEDLDDESTALQDVDRKFYGTLLDIFSALRKLPTNVQHVCNIQFFAWLGWFPVLFYSSTWVTEVLARGYHSEPLDDAFFDNATRAGSFALLLFATISLVTSFLVPFLSTEFAIQFTGSRFAFWLTPQGIWTFSHFLFAMLMAATLLVDKNVLYAQMILATCGICWGISMWVPFALVGAEAARERNNPEAEYEEAEDDFQDCLGELEAGRYGAEDGLTTTGLSSGMLLGIHNVYVVLPQFVTSVIAAGVFALFSASGNGAGGSGGGGVGGGIGGLDDSVGLVMRIGGLSALVAGILSYSYYGK